MAMKPATMILTCALLAGGVEMYLGQDSRRTFGNGVLQEHISMYDADDDGGISVEELQALQADQKTRRNRLASRWDLNRDGRISNIEREAAKVRMRKLIEKRRLMRFEAEDENGDELLEQSEFFGITAVAATNSVNPSLAVDIFNHLDLDGDGFISKPEFLRGLDRTRTPSDVTSPAPVPKRHPNVDGGP
jgi:Ca2+-binding EF-hand superfamily protein